MADDSGTKHARAAPYIAFQTLKTFLDELKKHGTPGRIDRSVLTRFSGAVGSQLLGAIKFLQLVDDQAQPTIWLREMVDAFGTDEWQSRLGKLLQDNYAALFRINLANATPAQFNEAFRQAYPAKENVARKCIAFFLNAVRDAGLDISPRILRNSKPRAANGAGPRRRAAPTSTRPAGEVPQTAAEPIPPIHAPHVLHPKDPSQFLLDILNPKVMSEEEQKAVWTLILYLKKDGAP